MTRWRTFKSRTGSDLVLKEIRKLGLAPHEQQKLRKIMDSKDQGMDLGPADKPLTGYQGMRELVIRCGDRSFRLVYAPVSGGLVLLGLHLFAKKSQTAPKDLGLAWDRLKEWRSRYPEAG